MIFQGQRKISENNQKYKKEVRNQNFNNISSFKDNRTCNSNPLPNMVNINLHIRVPISHMAIQLLINCKVMSYWHSVTASPLSIIVTYCLEMPS